MPTSSRDAIALRALVVLSIANLFNYADRYLASATKELYRRELGLTDVQTSLPLTGFIVVYMLLSPLFGALGDRHHRPRVLAFGVVLWSLATAAAAFAKGFVSLLVLRSLVGVGEAAFVAVCPSLIGDLFARQRLSRALSFFYLAVPVGVAMGFVAGSALGQAYGWRTTFLLFGAPGLVMAFLVWRLEDPTPERTAATEEAVPSWSDVLRALATNREYIAVVVGYTAMSFASGAIGDWVPAFLSRERGMSVAAAGGLSGMGLVVGGIAGTLLGGLVVDRLHSVVRDPARMASALSALGAVASVVFVLSVKDSRAILVGLVFMHVCLWFYNGPINAAVITSVPPRMRGRAFALSILVTHLLGDAISPPIAGALAGHTGGLRSALLILTPAALFVSFVAWWPRQAARAT